jgi:hypothetical protein
MFKLTLQQINNLTCSFHATRNFGKIFEKMFFVVFFRVFVCLNIISSAADH